MKKQPDGTKRMLTQGYIVIKYNGTWVREHRVVMERFLGRKLLSSESVHHINGVKTDNRVENLEIIDSRLHTQLHKTKFERYSKLPKQAVIGKRISSYDKDKLRTYDGVTCAICGKVFWERANSGRTCCSLSCGRKLAWKTSSKMSEVDRWKNRRKAVSNDERRY